MLLYISHRWRLRWAVWALFIAEFVVTIPALLLFALAQPDLYRTKLRTAGYDAGFNSGPLQQIFAMVNHVHKPAPLVWSQYVTDYNVVISVLTMFLLLVKVIFFIMHWFSPLVGVLLHGLIVGLWGYSLHAQTASDMSDPKRPQPGAPWYISKGCNAADRPDLVQYCRQAQGALAVTVFMLLIFALNTVLAIYSMIPTKAQRLARKSTISEESGDDLKFDPPPAGKGSKIWELQQYPKTPMKMEEPVKSPFSLKSPMTPRTVAYNRLGGSTTTTTTTTGAAAETRGSDLPFRNA